MIAMFKNRLTYSSFGWQIMFAGIIAQGSGPSSGLHPFAVFDKVRGRPRYHVPIISLPRPASVVRYECL